LAWAYEGREEQKDEELLVYKLFRHVHESCHGCLNLGGEPVWLVTIQVPNQAKQTKRCADLLGLRRDGSLIVFECKAETNRDSPMLALLEGLDYLAHLLLQENMTKLQNGFDKWRSKPRSGARTSVVPDKFKQVQMKSEARHTVVV